VDIADEQTWQCRNLTLKAGEWLYLPEGMAHAATTTASQLSLHATVGLSRQGHAWRDLAVQRCEDGGVSSCGQLRDLLWHKLDFPALGWLDLMGDGRLKAEDVDTECARQLWNARCLNDSDPTSLAALYLRNGKQMSADVVEALDVPWLEPLVGGRRSAFERTQ
jgi:hypothetical protein